MYDIIVNYWGSSGDKKVATELQKDIENNRFLQSINSKYWSVALDEWLTAQESKGNSNIPIENKLVLNFILSMSGSVEVFSKKYQWDFGCVIPKRGLTKKLRGAKGQYSVMNLAFMPKEIIDANKTLYEYDAEWCNANQLTDFMLYPREDDLLFYSSESAVPMDSWNKFLKMRKRAIIDAFTKSRKFSMQSDKEENNALNASTIAQLKNLSKTSTKEIPTIPLNQSAYAAIAEKLGSILNTPRIGIYVRKFFEECFKYKVSDEDLANFSDKNWCHDNFGMHYPMLLYVDKNISVEEQRRDSKGYNRYYKDVVIVNGEEYLFCSQWTDDFRPKLNDWINYSAGRQSSPQKDKKDAILNFAHTNQFINIQHDNFTNKRPKALFIDGLRIDVKNNADLFVKVCNFLIKRDKELFLKMIQDKENVLKEGWGESYFSSTSVEGDRREKLSGINLYVKTVFSAEKIRRMVIAMLKYYNIPLEKCDVYYSITPTYRNSKENEKSETDKNTNSDDIYFGNSSRAFHLPQDLIVYILRDIKLQVDMTDEFRYSVLKERFENIITGYDNPSYAIQRFLKILADNDIIRSKRKNYYEILNSDLLDRAIDNPHLLSSGMFHIDNYQLYEGNVSPIVSDKKEWGSINLYVEKYNNENRCTKCNKHLMRHKFSFDVYTNESKADVKNKNTIRVKECPECHTMYVTKDVYDFWNHSKRRNLTDLHFVLDR